MPWTQADSDALDSAIITAAVDGAAEVSFSDGRSVRRYTLDELMRLRDAVRANVGGSKNGGTSCTFGTFSKG